jgi:two-component system, OmpR family, sensor histidine kinase KdpD
VVVALSGGPEGETLIRRAARIAARSGADLLAFAHANNATQLVLGATPRTWRGALRPAARIRSRVIRHGGGLDVHIITCTPTAHGVPATSWWANVRSCYGAGGRL